MKEVEVESFKLDHRKVDAPYVREAGKIITPSGDVIKKYDLRLMQPNQGAISTAALHSLEHLLAKYMRQRIDNIIDLSPMGCRTGFYLSKIGETSLETIEEALVTSLQEVLATKEVQATTAKECGNYRDHSLFGAKEYAQQVLAGFKE
ncbi:LuxS protein involved in autoinducer AI2 synthesis [Halobacteroides halobius DSM 5150]|uniref:S-ribosylhomocysteine lyase n=1 Tax=Halobacteroides halobius (strain ATCC 35273 / DSM 5150 / MD-1) TaxID=748449 RepID=L0K9R6_HALHC|nr:S-ribosylhomocysteine lyase [Halobacteroides halobius]AGB40828.1 LuxS protein involved in autoinducer AI2 synthesis [Halobacteroides halobius DSM 5150]